MKKALITGITGQDGAYLAKFLLDRNYEVHGIIRRSSLPNTLRLTPFLSSLSLHSGDLTDASSLLRIIGEVEPDEIYNLGAQSHVADSFVSPEYTSNVNALGALRLLETIVTLKLTHRTRYYQASTSELYGLVQEIPQKETTPFYPRSPYAVSKLYAYWITINYREAYNIFGCNGILFNHESPMRGETFVTRKITRGLARILCGMDQLLHLGNLDAMRDWGHAKDYVEMQWLILQQDKAEDFVIASGEQRSVRSFVEIAAHELGIKLAWEGEGLNERGVVVAVHSSMATKVRAGQTIVAVDPKYFRPAEVSTLLGDAHKAKEKLGWTSKITFEQLVKEMAHEDLALAKRESGFLGEPIFT